MDKSEKLVSIIIPTYNRKTLLRAIGSALQQTMLMSSIEVVVVDDASTDDTKQILLQLKTSFQDSLIVITNDRNQGPGYSRNVGVSHSSGRYIFFLDSDDMLTSSAVEGLFNCAEINKSDIVLAKKASIKGYIHASKSTEISIGKTDVYNSNVFYTIGPAAKLYRREFIVSNGIIFNEQRNWGEDQPFVVKSYFLTENISIISDIIYLYLDEDEISLTKKKGIAELKVLTTLEVFEIIDVYAKIRVNDFKCLIFMNNIMPAIAEILKDGAITNGEKASLRKFIEKYWIDAFFIKLPQQHIDIIEKFTKLIDIIPVK